MVHIMVLADGVEKKYDTFSYQRQGFCGRNKQTSQMEVLGPEAITVIPSTSLIPDLNEMIYKTIETHVKEIAPELVKAIVKELEERVDKDVKSG